MSHFNLKSLSFYGVLIGGGLIFFKVVSAYGETHLQAPPAMGGNYEISAQELPECLSQKNVKLTIDQSGIYLFGQLTLSPKSDPQAKGSEIPLGGKLSQGKFSLTAPTNSLPDCPDLTIEGEEKEDRAMGYFMWDHGVSKSPFSAKMDKPKMESQPVH